MRTLIDPQRDLGPADLHEDREGYISRLHFGSGRGRSSRRSWSTRSGTCCTTRDRLTSRVGRRSCVLLVGPEDVRVVQRAAGALAEQDAEGDDMPVMLHEIRPNALKEQICDILCYCHCLSNRGGRDKTTSLIREHYSWISRKRISQFVKACPTYRPGTQS